MFINHDQLVSYIENKIGNLSSGVYVADLGCGSGGLSLSLAKKMNKKGRVYAVDIQKNLLEMVDAHAQAKSYDNLLTVWSDIEDIGSVIIPDNSLDIIILSNVMHQVSARDNVAKTLKQLLRVNGQFVFIDWNDSFNGMGPRSDMLFTMHHAHQWCEDNDFFINRVDTINDYHYGMVGSIR